MASKKEGAEWHWNVFVGPDHLRCSGDLLERISFGLVLLLVSWETFVFCCFPEWSFFPFCVLPDARSIYRIQSGYEQEIISST